MTSSAGPQQHQLADIDEATIARIEDGIFAEIQRDRRVRQAHRTHRRRAWIGTGAAAAVLVVAGLIAPAVVNSMKGASMGDSSAVSPASAPWAGVAQTEMGALRDMSGAGADGADATRPRDIIATGSASLSVDDVEHAARSIGDAAVAAGGYVDSMDLGSSGGLDGDLRYADRDPDSALPRSQSYGWISVRIPADQLTASMDALPQIGVVTASSVSRQDITAQTGDLRARIAAAETSVARLTELMAQSGSLADLIAAENALAERQAVLDSERQQLTMLEEQVAMSMLTVQLTPAHESVAANPAGFVDGLTTGWNSLVAALNGVVVALGFLAPWLVVIAIAGGIVWAIIAALRRRRHDGPTAK